MGLLAESQEKLGEMNELGGAESRKTRLRERMVSGPLGKRIVFASRWAPEFLEQTLEKDSCWKPVV